MSRAIRESDVVATIQAKERFDKRVEQRVDGPDRHSGWLPPDLHRAP
jgi:hypothetical protein